MTDTTATVEPKAKPKTFGRNWLASGAYTLDLAVVHDALVTVDGEPKTFAEAYVKLRDSKVHKLPEFGWTHYGTENGEIVLGGDWHLLSTLRDVVALIQNGFDPHNSRWFYYGNDSTREGDLRHTFFVVQDDKIVSESYDFGHDDPMILKKQQDTDPIWMSHPMFDEALERYWYRRFYTETLTGQLMVLRPDEPILYHYARPQTQDTARDVALVTLIKMYRLLWVAIPLLIAVVFPEIRFYMAIAAGALAIDVLWSWWATRKVGRAGK